MSYIQRKASNKFSAKRSDYNGKWYHSKGEASYAQELDWMLKAGEIKEWKGQHKIDIKVNGVHITNYYIDFRVITKHNSVQLIEYKGMETSDWRIKWNLLNALINEIEPGAELILIKHQSKWKPK
jgi:hypothetical protein